MNCPSCGYTSSWICAICTTDQLLQVVGSHCLGRCMEDHLTTWKDS